MATAEWFSCLRMRTIAIAHTNPERIPNQSPILRGTGKLRPNPKITNIPIMARIIATIRCHVMVSRSTAAANSVLHTGVR